MIKNGVVNPCVLRKVPDLLKCVDDSVVFVVCLQVSSRFEYCEENDNISECAEDEVK